MSKPLPPDPTPPHTEFTNVYSISAVKAGVLYTDGTHVTTNHAFKSQSLCGLCLPIVASKCMHAGMIATFK